MSLPQILAAILAYCRPAKHIISNIKADNPMPDTPQTPEIEPTAPPVAQPTPDKLKRFCEGIRDFEGRPGDRNYKNNNPGNCRYSPVGYLPIYGHVGKDKNNFAIFKDYATGFLYLENLIRSRIRNHPDWTILQLMENYAPASDDNNPFGYAKNLATRIGVDVNYPIKNLL